MIGKKVAKIEFHITSYEFEDFILRGAKLIEEGYSLETVSFDKPSYSIRENIEPPIHITFVKDKYRD